MIKIQFETDNAAFEEYNFNFEVARILHNLADHMLSEGGSRGEQLKPIFDLNGNRIGSLEVVF